MNFSKKNHKHHKATKNWLSKTKPFLFNVLFLCISYSITAQSNSQLISNILGQDATVSPSFIEGMIATGLSLNCDPWDDDAPCTDLCDPWDDDTPCPNTSIMKAKIASSPEMQVAIIKNTMTHFEHAIGAGKGGKFLDKKILSNAKIKFSGYKPIAMRARFKLYIKHLKSAQ